MPFCPVPSVLSRPPSTDRPTDRYWTDPSEKNEFYRLLNSSQAIKRWPPPRRLQTSTGLQCGRRRGRSDLQSYKEVALLGRASTEEGAPHPSRPILLGLLQLLHRMMIEMMMMMVREGPALGRQGDGDGRANPLISVRGKPNTSLSQSAGRWATRTTDADGLADLTGQRPGRLPANKPLITLALGEHGADRR